LKSKPRREKEDAVTDRYSGFIVVLDKDIREDDAENVVTALRMVKGVASVAPIPANPQSYIAEQRVRQEITTRVWEALKNEG
jgi:hypothetical protein